MLRCGYCYTDNPEYETNCDFCEAPLNVERKLFRPNQKFDNVAILYMNYPDCKQLNQVELLQLLTDAKELLADLSESEPPLSIAKEISRIKDVLQKKIHLLENLVFDLLGRVPRQTKTELNKAKNYQSRRIYTHKKNMAKKPVLPHHAFLQKRFF